MRTILRLLLLLITTSLMLPFSAWAATQDGKFVVVIDPGHGGGDVGTPRRKLKMDEKTVALKVSLMLGKKISDSHPDVKIVYTRKTDIYPSLPKRTQIAKQAKGDLFISIHVNASPDPMARGFETYIFGVSGEKGKTANEQKRLRQRMEEERENLDISGKAVNFDTDIDIETKILCQTQREKHNHYSKEFAHDVQTSLIKALRRTSYKDRVLDRGVKAKNLFVLCYSPMPSVLIELGYMSNEREERFINSQEGLETFAQAIYQGFRQYKRKWDKRQLPSGKHNTAANYTTEFEAETDAPAPDPAPVATAAKAPATTSTQTDTVANTPAATPAKTGTAAEIIYRVQFLTSAVSLEANNALFKGIAPTHSYKDGNLWKYTHGAAVSMAEATRLCQEVRKKFPDAFVAKFGPDGNRIK